MKTQLDHLRTHLISGRSISPLEALGLYGVFRLAARIKELRNKGWDIDTTIRYDPNGKTYAVYTLAADVAPDMPMFINQSFDQRAAA